MFSNIEHFIPCKKASDIVHVLEIIFKEVVRLHRLPKSIVLDQSIPNFLGIFSIHCGRNQRQIQSLVHHIIHRLMDRYKL